RKAEMYYARAAEEHPDYALVGAALAELHLKKGKFDDAVAAASRVLGKTPYNARALAKIAKVHRAQGDRRLALEYAGKALEAHYGGHIVEDLKGAFAEDSSFQDLMGKTEARVTALFDYFEKKYDYQHLSRDYDTTVWIFSEVGYRRD